MNEAELIEKVTKIATTTTLEYIENRHKERKKKQLRNTKLLLKHYRELLQHVQNYEPGAPIILPESIDSLQDEELAIESIRKNRQRTFIMVQFITRSLETYRILCEQSDKPEQIRRYHIIVDLYVAEPRKSIKEIADCHKIENRTIYRDINEAAEALSALIFGVDGIKLFG